MQSRRQWFGSLSVIVAAIVGVGVLGGFAFGWGGMRYGTAGGGFGCRGWAVSSFGPSVTDEQAVDAAQQYVVSLGNDNLELVEVMAFDNHYYGEVREADTGRHAFEFLIDRGSGRITPEPGPNMMWNQKYGSMAGGMMGLYRRSDSGDSMPVTEAEAVISAQAYLDRLGTGLHAGDHAAPFYGYYTLHTLRNGEVVGMLSVNGYTRDVWLHSWHGAYLGTPFEDE